MSKPLHIEHQLSADQWDWPQQKHDGVVKITNTDELFEVGLEVHYFTPKEIKVNVIDGNKLCVNCVHDTREDSYGSIRREIHRMYQLPEDVDPSTLKTKMDAKGVLHISGGKKKA